jgi:hypothetical protein
MDVLFTEKMVVKLTAVQWLQIERKYSLSKDGQQVLSEELSGVPVKQDDRITLRMAFSVGKYRIHLYIVVKSTSTLPGVVSVTCGRINWAQFRATQDFTDFIDGAVDWLSKQGSELELILNKKHFITTVRWG